MSFEPRIEKVVSNYKSRIGEMQSQIECKLQAPNGEELKRVLSTNVRVNIPSASVSQNAVNFDGVAMVQVVYETMEGSIGAMDYTLEFKDRYIANTELILTDIVIFADVVDAKSMVENGGVKVSAILNITIDAIIADNNNIVVSCIGEDVYTKYEDVEYSSYIGVASEKFEIASDIEIKDAVSKILNVCPKACIDKVEPNDNYIKVSGSIITTITYLTSGEIEDVRTYESVSEFTQEIALNGVTRDCLVTSNISCVYQNISITTDLGADSTIINMVLPIEYKGYVWCLKEIQMVADMYSAKHNISLMDHNIVTQKHTKPMIFAEKISGSYNIDDNMPAIDEILGTTCNNVVVANQRVEDGVLIVDGLATTTVIYKNNEMKKVECVEIQLPFSLDLNVGDIREDAIVNVLATISKVQAKARRGTDIEVGAELLLYVEISHNAVSRIISEANILDEKLVVDSNLTIYIVKDGDTIWDIAKEMSVSEECILAQNPRLELPIKAGERVVIYRQSLARM